MVDQYKENQYDDDLTVGADEYDEYISTDSVDLFEYSDQEESQTGRLKSLILSIDWEITDEVLMQFNEELVYLEGIWHEEKVNLVYVQALQKISKYIYQQKANAHPNAIKLLLKFYYNLERIVSSEDLSSEQKKEILLEDVKNFDGLKRKIAHQAQDRVLYEGDLEDQGLPDRQEGGDEADLLNLKATVLGIDWEITDEDLNNLRSEVVRLEEKYAESRPRLILLQGIGTLGAYIKVYKVDAHRDVFKLLHLFFETLEKIVKTPMSLEEEKALLFPTIDEFNAFKDVVGPTLTAGTISEEDDGDGESTGIQPALADFQEDEGRGFQEDEEAQGLGDEGLINVSNHIDQFFGIDEDALLETAEQEDTPPVEDELAAGHVDIDSTVFDDASPDLADEDSAVAGPESPDITLSVDRDLAMQGVEVETEADDDSDEDALPIEDSGVIAPALSDSDQASIYGTSALADSPTDASFDKTVIDTLDDFFIDELPEEIEEPAVEPEVIGLTVVDEVADTVEEEDLVIFELVEDDYSDDVSADMLMAIGQHLNDLDTDFDEEAVVKLALEISRLQEHWAGKTLEMSLLQLLSSVTQYIDRYRFDSDPTAYEMLQSNYAALGLLERGAVEHNEEVLFEQISKTVTWQQDLLFLHIMPK